MKEIPLPTAKERIDTALGVLYLLEEHHVKQNKLRGRAEENSKTLVLVREAIRNLKEAKLFLPLDKR